MDRFHLDSLLRIVSCSEKNCSVAPSSAHFTSREEAYLAANLTREIESIKLPKRQMNFHKSFSAKTNEYYLEASVSTPLEEEAFFTVEKTDNCFRGTMLFTGREIVLANMTDFMNDPLEETARITALEAERLYGFDLWPDKEIVDLFDKLRAHSSEERMVAPGVLSLDLVKSSADQQFYLGETITGTPISIRVAHAYAVAFAQVGDDFQIVHESSIFHQFLLESSERAAFVAKSFGRLISLKEI